MSTEHAVAAARVGALKTKAELAGISWDRLPKYVDGIAKLMKEGGPLAADIVVTGMELVKDYAARDIGGLIENAKQLGTDLSSLVDVFRTSFDF